MAGDNTIRVFDGAVAIITGGASGIGLAMAKQLAFQGCEVVLADLQSELAEEAAAKICQGGGKATAATLNVTDATAVANLVKETANRCGRLDYMFNNAGIGIGGEAKDYELDDWNVILDVNLHGVVNGVQAAYQQMLGQGFGHIVNTASLAGLIPTAVTVNYAMTKYAVVGLSISLRGEAACYGVRVSVLCPGVIRTPLLSGGKFGKLPSDVTPEIAEKLFERVFPMDPDAFAKKAIRKVARNKPIIIVPSILHILWGVTRFFPSLGIWMSQKMFEMGKKHIKSLNEKNS